MSGERGQVMVLVAILSGVLVGFVGLVIDIGGVASAHELAQGAADGAALAAAYEIEYGGTEAGATTHAQAVLTQENLPASALTMTYLDSGGNPTATVTSVTAVTAAVSFNYAARFMPILGVATLGVSGTAGAAVPEPPCGLCVMKSSSNALQLGGSSLVTVSGNGTVVNSTSNPNVNVNAGSVLTSTFNRLAANHVNGSGTITPAVTVGSAVADPLPNLATPGAAALTIPPINTPNSGSQTLVPDEYQGLTINGSFAVTMSPGTYIITGTIQMKGGTLTGTGVTLYLACGSFPTACNAGGQGGGRIQIQGGVTTLTAPTTGTYEGVVIYADRNNNATNSLGGGSNSFASTGTIYTELMPWTLNHNNDSYTLSSELVASTLNTNSGTSLTLNVSANQNAPGQTGSVPGVTPSLSL